MKTSFSRWGLLIVLAAVFAARCKYEYQESVKAWRQVRTLRYESFFSAGLVSTVRWIHAQGAVREVYGERLSSGPYLYQRLSEMLYPIMFRPLGDAPPKPGDLVILRVDRTVPWSHERVFQSGELQVLRAER